MTQNPGKPKFSLEDFFPVEIDASTQSEERPYPLYLYLELNHHLLLLRRSYQALETKALNRYLDRGIKNLWCPMEFLKEWERYVSHSPSKDTARASGETEPQKLNGKRNPEDGKKAAKGRTEESALATDILNSDQMNDEQKKSILSDISQEMIAVLAAAGSDDPKDKEEAIEKCQNFAEDIIQVAMSENETEDIYKQIQLIHEEIGLEHSTATATFAVIFSLGIGYTDQQDLSQIALSGLLHDIGFVKIDHELLTIPENAMNADQKRKFQEHVDHSIHILDDVDLNLPEEIIDIIYQHHERFDGSGYPNGASGFEINDLSQLISVADHLDDIMAGRFDGVEKSPAQALDLLKKMQNKNNVPSLFNPDIFSRIRHLIENGENLAEQQKKAQERTQESLRQTG